MGRLRPAPTLAAGLSTSQVYRDEPGSSHAAKVHRLRRWQEIAVKPCEWAGRH